MVVTRDEFYRIKHEDEDASLRSMLQVEYRTGEWRGFFVHYIDFIFRFTKYVELTWVRENGYVTYYVSPAPSSYGEDLKITEADSVRAMTKSN